MAPGSREFSPVWLHPEWPAMLTLCSAGSAHQWPQDSGFPLQPCLCLSLVLSSHCRLLLLAVALGGRVLYTPSTIYCFTLASHQISPGFLWCFLQRPCVPAPDIKLVPVLFHHQPPAPSPGGICCPHPTPPTTTCSTVTSHSLCLQH